MCNYLSRAIILSYLCVLPTVANWPTYPIEEGQTAVVPCIPKGDGQAYFWTKGESFATSSSIASRVLGIPSSASERYSTASNGSLLIFGANRGDEGTYYCRIVSEKTNCHGAVSIFVQVLYDFGIDECNGFSDCVVFVGPSAVTELTCSAKFATSSISVKWYNGSNEITSFSGKEENGDSFNISETIWVQHQVGLLLICQAIDLKIGRTSARNAYVRLENIAEPEGTNQCPNTWVIPVVLIFLIIIAIPVLYVTRSKWSTWFSKAKHEEDEEQMKTLISSESDEVKTLKERLAQQMNIVEENRREIESLEATVADQTKTLESKNDEVKTLKEHQAQQTKIVEENRREIESLEATVADQTKTLEDNHREIESLKAMLADQTKSLESWDDKDESHSVKPIDTPHQYKSTEEDDLFVDATSSVSTKDSESSATLSCSTDNVDSSAGAISAGVRNEEESTKDGEPSASEIVANSTDNGDSSAGATSAGSTEDSDTFVDATSTVSTVDGDPDTGGTSPSRAEGDDRDAGETSHSRAEGCDQDFAEGTFSKGESGDPDRDGTSSSKGESGDPDRDSTSSSKGESGDRDRDGASSSKGESGDRDRDETSSSKGESGDPDGDETPSSKGESGDPDGDGTSSRKGESGDPDRDGTSSSKGESGDPDGDETSSSKGESGDPDRDETSSSKGESGDPDSDETSSSRTGDDHDVGETLPSNTGNLDPSADATSSGVRDDKERGENDDAPAHATSTGNAQDYGPPADAPSTGF